MYDAKERGEEGGWWRIYFSSSFSFSLSLIRDISKREYTFTFILRLSKCERVECNRDSSGALLNTSSPMYYTIVVNTCLSYSLGARALVPVDVSDIILFVI